MVNIEIDILNYNGASLLATCLPSIIRAMGKSRYACRLVVVDNGSTDESERIVREEFPTASFYRAAENRVLCSFNDIARLSTSDVLILLNNDLVVDEHFIDPLVENFLENDNVFLSAARVFNFDGTDIEEARAKPVLAWGTIKVLGKYPGYEREMETPGYTFQAGFGAFDRKKFLELGGYDPLYLPGILEDTDICFRAWKRGYVCLYQPRSTIYHMGKVSFTKRFGRRRLLAMSHRNTYFFIWKNITDARLLVKNIIFTIPRMLYACLTLKWEMVWGLGWFVRCLPAVMAARKRERERAALYRLADRDVFKLFTTTVESHGSN